MLSVDLVINVNTNSSENIDLGIKSYFAGKMTQAIML